MLALWVLGSVSVQWGHTGVPIPLAEEYDDKGEASLGITLVKNMCKILRITFIFSALLLRVGTHFNLFML